MTVVEAIGQLQADIDFKCEHGKQEFVQIDLDLALFILAVLELARPEGFEPPTS